jgi:hypothetical protein
MSNAFVITVTECYLDFTNTPITSFYITGSPIYVNFEQGITNCPDAIDTSTYYIDESAGNIDSASYNSNSTYSGLVPNYNLEVSSTF